MEVYAIVRAHGLRARLLTKEDYEAILRGARKLWEYPEYSGIAEKDPLDQKLDKVYRVYVRRMEFLASLSPRLRSFIYALLDRLEVENLKIHLRHVMGYRRPVVYYPYARFLGPAKLVTLSTEGALWQALQGTPYALPKDFTFKTAAPVEREALIESLYFKHLLAEVEALRAPPDAISAIRGLVHRDYTVRYNLWERALGPKLASEVAKALGLSGVLVSELLDRLRALPESEALLQGFRDIYRAALRVAREHPLDAAYICAFNVLACVEAQNLERIILGSEVGIAEEVINKQLIY